MGRRWLQGRHREGGSAGCGPGRGFQLEGASDSPGKNVTRTAGAWSPPQAILERDPGSHLLTSSPGDGCRWRFPSPPHCPQLAGALHLRPPGLCICRVPHLRTPLFCLALSCAPSRTSLGRASRTLPATTITLGRTCTAFSSDANTGSGVRLTRPGTPAPLSTTVWASELTSVSLRISKL